MARYKKAAEVLEIADQLRERCLRQGLSMFSEEKLWTHENSLALERYYVNNPDVGGDDFLTKLENQLSSASNQAKQLAAELLWALYLFLAESFMRPETKQAQVRRVWEWSGVPFPESVSYSVVAPTPGVGSPGTAYNTQRWREYRFFVLFLKDWTSLSERQQEGLLGDPWEFAQWVDTETESEGRQFRHILLSLLFPDTFERICTGDHKRRIVAAFRDEHGRDPSFDPKNRLAVDRELLAIRKQLEKTEGEDIDFYTPELLPRWRKDAVPPEEVKQKTTPDAVERWYVKKFGDHRVWILGAGSNARLWQEFQRDKIAAIGWDFLGDLLEYDSREEIHEELKKELGSNPEPSNSSLACYQFAQEMNPDDHILIKKGRREIVAHGIVRSDYRYDVERPTFRHVREMDWLQYGSWIVPGGAPITTKTLTDFTPYKQWLRDLFSVLEVDTKKRTQTGKETVPPYSRNDALKDLFMTSEQLSRIESVLGRKRNVILEGPPGVGKTFFARRLAYLLLGYRDDSRVESVEFHQSFAYEDFVQGWRPTTEGGFEVRDGIFVSFCKIASQDGDRPYVFIIDEINRANISKVFGELLALIEADKRVDEYAVRLPCSSENEPCFYIPQNVCLIGMMNTADRSLAFVDYALRRRFAFFRIEPAFETEAFQEYLLQHGVDQSLLEMIVRRLSVLNDEIRADKANLGHGFEIGHSYFVPQEGDEPDRQWYEEVVRTEIAPLLREYWFDRPDVADQHINSLLS